MQPSINEGRLYLNDEEVGNVTVQRWLGPWGIGQFQPATAFGRYAPLYNKWSRLMRNKRSSGRGNRRIADALRKIEFELYRIRARILLQEGNQWRDIALLNIDGPLIEWKERA